MTLHEPGQREPEPKYALSYIPPCANPGRERFDELCFDMPVETYDRAAAATQAAGPKGQTKERWLTIRHTPDVIVELWPKFALLEGSGPSDGPIDHNDLSPLLDIRELDKAAKLPPLLGDVRITWKSDIGILSDPAVWRNVVLEARKARTRRRLARILPIGRPLPVARVTGYTARQEPKGSESRNYTRPES